MSLAITEKKHQRPSGCAAGIFFQLLEWNRKLANKKIFPKNLMLAPVRAGKKAVKKFGVDEKMPMAKLLLIADENRGGFPRGKKPVGAEIGEGMRAPGLVARLMGLESMPVVAKEKSRNVAGSELGCDENENGVLGVNVSQEIGRNGRPLKLQKTGGFLERRRSGNEGCSGPNLLGKGGLGFCSKNGSRKLVSPVKSPRLGSGSHRPRLMQAATKILEPGIRHSRTRRCAITYGEPSVTDKRAMDDVANMTLMKSKELLSDPFIGSSSCSGQGREFAFQLCDKESSGGDNGASSFCFSVASSSQNEHGETNTVPLGMENEPSHKNLFANKANVNIPNREPKLAERNSYRQNNQNVCNPKPAGELKGSLRETSTKQNKTVVVKDEVAFGSKICNRKKINRDSMDLSLRKDFLPTSRTVNKQRQTRPVSEMPESSRETIVRNSSCESNMARKRTISSSRTEIVNPVSSFSEGRNLKADLVNRKGRGFTSRQSISRKFANSELKKSEDNTTNKRASDIVSFSFNSPIRHSMKPSFSDENKEKLTGQSHIHHNPLFRVGLTSEKINHNLSSHRRMIFKGDELSSMLEQKIKELTFMDLDGVETRNGRSTASILQQLIADLTNEPCISEHQDHVQTIGHSTTDAMNSDCKSYSTSPIMHKPKNNKEPQKKEEVNVSSAFLSNDNDQPSPISVLEASFSNDSCSFENLYTRSGCRLYHSLADSYTRETVDMDNDLLDSATSNDLSKCQLQKIKQSFDTIPTKLAKLSSDMEHTRIKLDDGKEIIVNAEKLFQVITLYNLGLEEGFSVEHVLLDMLEIIMDAFSWQNGTTCKVTTKAGLPRECIFDCMIQFLDSKYASFCKWGHKTKLQYPLLLTKNHLVKEILDELSGWIDLAGKVLDNLLEKDMNHWTSTWIDSKIETTDMAVDIESGIIHTLISEMIIDIC